MKKSPKLVLIEWVDSARPVSDWKFLDDPPALESIQCVSVGWLIRENKRTKMLVPNIGDIKSGGSSQGSGFIRIPVASVTRQVELVERN